MSRDSSIAPTQTKVLRRLYLMLFLRGRSARGLNVNKNAKSIFGRLWMTLAFYALAGCVVLGFIGQPLFSLSIYLHGATLFFVGMFVAASSGEMLFNKEEAEILLHRPVSPRGMLWAKISVLVQVSLWLGLAFNLVGMIYGTFSSSGGFGFGAVHLVSTSISALFCAGMVVLVYQLCLKWFGRERLDGLMTFMQVVMALVLVLGGQVVPHLLRYFPGEIRLTAETWWLALLPPAWFASLDETLMGRGNPATWSLAAIGIFMTSGVMALAFGKLAGSYETGLQTLGESRAVKPAKNGGGKFLQRLAAVPPLSWLLRDPLERAGFLLLSAYMLRDRDVKLRLYPGLAPIMAMPLIFMVNGFRSGDSDYMLLMSGGYLALVPMLALKLLQYSQNWQATDVFHVTPTPGPGALMIGARKAVSVFLVLPGLLVMGAFFVLITGGWGQLIYLLPGVLSLPIFGRVLALDGRFLPLSMPVEDAKSAGRGLKILLPMFAALGVGGAAAVAKSFGYYYEFLLAEMLLAGGIALLMDRKTRGLRWPTIEETVAVTRKS
jgi:hypothetical protein